MDDKDILPALDTIQIEPIKATELDELLKVSTINLDDLITDSSFTFSNMNTTSYGNITINTGAQGAPSYSYSNSNIGSNWSTLNSNSSGLHVSADAEFEGDVKIKGVSILETLQKIEKRLSILRPDPEKLEHFAALKKAYEHYKTLEALCELPSKEEE